MKVPIYCLLTNSTKDLMTVLWRNRSSLTKRLYVIIDMRETNIINLSSRHLSNDEVSLFSKGLQFVPTPKHINKAKIKEEIEVYGRKFSLMRHFRNDHQEFHVNLFKKKSKFNPKGTLP